MKASRRIIKRPNMRRAVILFPSGFTLGNLFFGIFAIIAASRLEFTTAGVYVMLGGICDALDGRVARATNSGTQFGEELDSLVDAITFGLAPGMIMYFAVLNRDGWDWVFVFLFAACAVLRLARFNIEQAGTAKTYFQGLPSPAAGITLASYYWFSQSWLYSYGAVADLKWHVLLRFIMVALSILMISNVPYPTFPRTGFRSLRALGATIVVFGAIALLLSRKLEYFFPLSLVYVAWGLVRWIFSGLFERRQPTVPYDLSEGEDEEDEEEYEVVDSQVHASRAPRRQEPAPRADGGRGRNERPARPEREPRPARTEVPAGPERLDRPERPDRPPREDAGEGETRPQRTEAERAARRDKRDKRDKREGREPRPERAPRPDREPRAERAAANIALEPLPSVPELDRAPVVAIPRQIPLPGDDDATAVLVSPTENDDGAAAADAPARKRKRRRRRGSRERGENTGGAGSGGESDNDGDAGPDEQGTDGGDDRSPYSAPAPVAASINLAPAPATSPAPRPYLPPLPAPTPAKVAPSAPGGPTSPESE